MPPFKTNMSLKLFKHTFYIDQFAIKEGEIVTLDPKEETYTFSLTLEGMGMFEEEYGEPVYDVLFRNINNEDLAIDGEISSRDFIRALACSSYLKIENNQVFNNDATKEEFKALPIYRSVSSDLTFVRELVAMAFACATEDRKKKSKNNGKKEKN